MHSTLSLIGGIIYPIIFYRIVSPVGFPWVVRIIAFIMLSLSVLPVTATRMKTKPTGVRKLLQWDVFKGTEYTLFALATTFAFLGLYVPYFYVQLYAQEQGIITGDLNFYLLALMNTGGFFGRVVYPRSPFSPLSPIFETS